MRMTRLLRLCLWRPSEGKRNVSCLVVGHRPFFLGSTLDAGFILEVQLQYSALF